MAGIAPMTQPFSVGSEYLEFHVATFVQYGYFYDEDIDVTVYNFNKFMGLPEDEIVEIESSELLIDWLVQHEQREWGIKGIDVCVRSVKGKIHWKIDAWEGKPERTGEIDISDFTVESNLGDKLKDGEAVVVTDIDIDLADKSIVVS